MRAVTGRPGHSAQFSPGPVSARFRLAAASAAHTSAYVSVLCSTLVDAASITGIVLGDELESLGEGSVTVAGAPGQALQQLAKADARDPLQVPRRQPRSP